MTKITKNGRGIYLTAILLVLIASCNTTKKQQTRDTYRLVAEWEPTEYLWVQWMEGEMGGTPPLDKLVIEMVKALTPHVKVTMIVPDDQTSQTVKARFRKEGIDLNRIEFMIANSPGAITDPSPVLLINSQGKLATIDFNWNTYGLDPDKTADHTITGEKFDIEMAAQLGIPVLSKSELVWEGGAKEKNSKGVLILVEQTEFSRNPGWTKARIEEEHKIKLNAKQIIWLKKGLFEDEVHSLLPGGYYAMGTDGHIDEFCRFVNDSTIMLAEVSSYERDTDSIHAENYRRMEENFKILKNAKNYDGRPFRIIRIPVADHYTYQVDYEDMEPWMRYYFPGIKPGQMAKGMATTSYLNFIIANDLVITASYWKEGRVEAKKLKDEQVRDIFQIAFPDKKIIQIDMEGYNNGGGGMHCGTYNEHVGNSNKK